MPMDIPRILRKFATFRFSFEASACKLPKFIAKLIIIIIINFLRKNQIKTSKSETYIPNSLFSHELDQAQSMRTRMSTNWHKESCKVNRTSHVPLSYYAEPDNLQLFGLRENVLRKYVSTYRVRVYVAKDRTSVLSVAC